MRHPRRFLPLGSVSGGTLRPEDIVHEILCSLRADNLRLSRSDRRKVSALSREWEGIAERGEDNPWGGFSASEGEDFDNLSEILAELHDIAENYTPPGCYFGSHEGDGAAIGVWFSPEIPSVELTGAESREEREEKFSRALRHSLSEDLILQVSDHGNLLGVWADSAPLDSPRRKWRRLPERWY